MYIASLLIKLKGWRQEGRALFVWAEEMRQQQYARHNHCHHNCHHHWPHHYYCHIILCSDIIIIFILYVTNDCIDTTIIMTKVKFFKKNIESIFHLEPTPPQPSSSHQR